MRHFHFSTFRMLYEDTAKSLEKGWSVALICEIHTEPGWSSGCLTDSLRVLVSNGSMAEHRFHLKRTMTSDRQTVKGQVVADVVPVHIDPERMDRHLTGPRHKLPAHANTPEEICSFLDSLAKDLR